MHVLLSTKYASSKLMLFCKTSME